MYLGCKALPAMRTSFLLLLILPLWTLTAQQRAGQEATWHTEGLDRLEGWVQGEIDAGRLPMAEVLLYADGAVGYRATFGSSNTALGTPLTENQIYHIMSMTKPVVSVAFMMLYEEGHFRLRDRVADYLPEFTDPRVALATSQGLTVPTREAESALTIEQLLTHTAGFSHGLGETAFDREFAQAMYYQPHADIEARVRTLASLPLVSEPGEQWYYSAAPDVLARLIEHFSGQSVAKFLQQRLFDPLGMEDTGYNVQVADSGRVVANHGLVEEAVQLAGFQLPQRGNRIYGGTHGLYSTPSDYLRFCRMLLNKGELDGRRYLSPSTVELMTMNHVGELRPRGEGFGLGFGVITDVAANKVAGSVGTYYWSGAYSTYFFVDPKRELIAMLFSQRSPYSGFHGEMFRQLVYQATGR